MALQKASFEIPCQLEIMLNNEMYLRIYNPAHFPRKGDIVHLNGIRFLVAGEIEHIYHRSGSVGHTIIVNVTKRSAAND